MEVVTASYGFSAFGTSLQRGDAKRRLAACVGVGSAYTPCPDELGITFSGVN